MIYLRPSLSTFAPRGFPWRLGARWLGTLLWVLLLALAGAQGISFTVQVIAVSDQQNAIDISRVLLQAGYPAYVVRSTGAEGDVYRVRVGAFANRLAAVRYAAAMPGVGGSQPVPMVAEAIPTGIMPLAPRVLWQGSWAAGELRVLPWPAGIALRQQQLVPLAQARYTLVQAGEVRTLEAWWLLPLAELPPTFLAGPGAPSFGEVPFIDLRTPTSAEAPALGESSTAEPLVPRLAASDPTSPAEVGVLLLRDRLLWPENWEVEGSDVRDAFAASTLALVAGRMGLDPAVLSAAVWQPEGEGAPRLRTVEVSDRSARDMGDVRAVAPVDVRAVAPADADAAPWGPAPAEAGPWWPALAYGEVLAEHSRGTGTIGGAAWTLAADRGFVRITTAAGSSWRAVVGDPLWSDGRYALVQDGDDLQLIDFVLR